MNNDQPTLPEAFDDLLRVVSDDPDPERAAVAAEEAMTRAGFFARWSQWADLALPEELTPEQHRVAVALLRADVDAGGHGLPSSKRLLRRWLGVDGTGVLERRVAWTHDGVTEQWPLWKIWREAPTASLEHNQGVPTEIMGLLTPAELIEAAAERVLEPYGIRGSTLEERLRTTLELHGATAAAWAAPFADRLASLRSPDGPRALASARGYRMLNIYRWDELALITLVPLVRAGVPLEARWDIIAPFTRHALGREILMALPADRREAVVYRRLMTDWGSDGALNAVNGFDTGLALLDLAPSERVTQVLAAKLRNCRGEFKKRIDSIRARLDALAAEHPAVAAGLKPRRGGRKTIGSALTALLLALAGAPEASAQPRVALRPAIAAQVRTMARHAPDREITELLDDPATGVGPAAARAPRPLDAVPRGGIPSPTVSPDGAAATPTLLRPDDHPWVSIGAISVRSSESESESAGPSKRCARPRALTSGRPVCRERQTR